MAKGMQQMKAAKRSRGPTRMLGAADAADRCRVRRHQKLEEPMKEPRCNADALRKKKRRSQ